MLTSLIYSEINAHLAVTHSLFELIPAIETAVLMAKKTLLAGGRIFLAGNGGSAADAQHLASELTGRFRSERKGLPAIALTTDTSALTSIANDYGYQDVFRRQLEALATPNDLFIAITTSGNSPNILEALYFCKKQGIKTIGLLGKDGGQAADFCEAAVIVRAQETARIQEMHILIGHIMCAFLDKPDFFQNRR